MRPNIICHVHVDYVNANVYVVYIIYGLKYFVDSIIIAQLLSLSHVTKEIPQILLKCILRINVSTKCSKCFSPCLVIIWVVPNIRLLFLELVYIPVALAALLHVHT